MDTGTIIPATVASALWAGYRSIGRAVTTLSHAAAANAKCFPITMRVIWGGKLLHSAALYSILQQ